MAQEPPAVTPGPHRLPPTTRMALAFGRSAALASRALGRGRGHQVGGKIAYRLHRDALADLARGRTTALVSATNGKSTTTHLLAAAVRSLGPTAFNASGANMEEGLVAALDADRQAPWAVLETDEAYLDVVAEATRPAVIVLMNLSRDFLERGVRAKALASLWRGTLAALDWPCTVVANADDPLVAWAVRSAPRVVWVSGEDAWQADSALCRDCLVRLVRDGREWECPRCSVRRPRPHWSLTDDGAVGPGGDLPLAAALPGHAARVNALFAVAAAVELGVPGPQAAARIAEVENVDGRYAPHRVGDHLVRVLLAKNPASWTEALTTVLAASDERRELVLAMHARGGGGGQDTAMLWDAPFERLQGRPVTVAGSRATDLALRLEAAGVEPTIAGRDVVAALDSVPPGPVDLVANWPAFNEVLDSIGRGT